MESIVDYNDEYGKDDAEASSSRISETTFVSDEGQPQALPLTQYTQKGAEEVKEYLNKSVRLFTKSCESDRGLSMIYQNFSPYLYPFSVEYSILVG